MGNKVWKVSAMPTLGHLEAKSTFIDELILVAGLLIPAHAATTKWVDQVGGSDANDGNSEPMAYKTLQFAIDNSTSTMQESRRCRW